MKRLSFAWDTFVLAMVFLALVPMILIFGETMRAALKQHMRLQWAEKFGTPFPSDSATPEGGK